MAEHTPMSKHECEVSLYLCSSSHPRIHVWKGRGEALWAVGRWYVSPAPAGDAGYATHAEAIKVATERARADAVRGVTDWFAAPERAGFYTGVQVATRLRAALDTTTKEQDR